MSSRRRQRIWEVNNLLTKSNLVSVVTDAVIALDLDQSTTSNVAGVVAHVEGNSLFCTSCQCSISDTIHYKTDWHIMNAKLKAVGAKPVSQTEFEKLGLENDVADEDAYIEERALQAQTSSASSSLEVSANTGSARITFITKDNQTLAIWKSVLLPGRSGTIAEYAFAALKFNEPIHTSFNAPIQSSSKNETTPNALVSPLALQALPRHPFQWLILLCQGGFFAGAVFRGDQVLRHKRIARYTVRRKQGGSQASKDQTKGGIHSAGASIRRYNETRLREEIAELLEAWKVEIAQSSLIFLHAPSFNSSSFYYEGSPISRRDPRVRHIPIVTQRPSFVELQRIHIILSTVEISDFESIDKLRASLEMAPQQTQSSTSGPVSEASSIMDSMSIRSSSSSIISLKEGEYANWAQLGDTERDKTPTAPQIDLLAQAIERNDVAEVRRLILEEDYLFPIPEKAEDLVWPLMLAIQLHNAPMAQCLIECGENLDSRSPKYALRTALHVACAEAWDEMVELLMEMGANPTLLDLYGHTAYDLCKEKSTRTLLRKFAGANLDLWDWTASRIPPLTDSMEEEARAKEAEKRRRKKAAQKERKKLQKEEDEVNRAIEAERAKQLEEETLAKEAALERTKKMLTMSEREKRALAAERRLNPKANLCDNCGQAITTEPFEKFSFKYCSSNCVVEHKRVLDALQQTVASGSK